MTATYKHIRFEEIQGFTVCRSNHGGAVLGRVEWMARWKEYEFIPETDTAYTVECLRDLADFVGKMNAARKANNNLTGAESVPSSGKDEMITCRGIELGDGNYSGCDTRNHTLTDCPTCHGSGIETPHLIDLLKRFEQGCRLDRDDTFADLLMQARMTIEGLVDREDADIEFAWDETSGTWRKCCCKCTSTSGIERPQKPDGGT